MGHDHSHDHSHALKPQAVNTAFMVGIGLNLLFVVVEALIGLSVHSLSLLSDAGHNLADVASLALSLLAFRLMRVKASDRYTYGYSKTTILVALFNGVVLLVSIGAIGYEALHRFFNPEPLPGSTIAIVAGVGIVINGLTAFLFFREKDKDLNIKSAYLHLLADAVVSLGLVVGGIIIYNTGWYWVDSALSIIVAVVILFSTWSLFKHSLRLSLDGVPAGITLEEVRKAAVAVPGVLDIHHIHLWAISTTKNALTAHVVINHSNTLVEAEKITHSLKHILEHLNIQHITLEVETEVMNCETKEH